MTEVFDTFNIIITHFKAWHLLGTIISVLSFPCLFMPPPLGCHTDENKLNCTSNTTTENVEDIITLYYSVIAVVWTLGFATLKVSHLSMVPEITACENTRMSLISLTYGGTLLSYTSVYGVAWILLDAGQ